jgi:large subunit ribosomal protein L45
MPPGLSLSDQLWPNAAILCLVRSKHYDRKWRKLRAQKVLKMELPDYDKLRREANMAPDEMRAEMKRLGRLPPRNFQERNIIIASTNSIFEAYVPPEGDGIASPISGKGAKQRLTELEKKGKSLLQVRKIRKFDETFDSKEFAQQALDIYIEAHQLLENIKENEDRLHQLVTEKAYPEMTWKLEKKSFRWQYIESLEPPRVVHVRTTEMINKENLYAQVTVRMLTRQILAIYDRFGRLAFGSEKLAKDCLEYVVFEKHIADEYGQWRLHGKIIPEWLTGQQQPVLRTVRQPDFGPLPNDTVEGTADNSDVHPTSTENTGVATV